MRLIKGKPFVFYLALYTLLVFKNVSYAEPTPNSLQINPTKQCALTEQNKVDLKNIPINIDHKSFLAASPDCQNSYLSQLIKTLQFFMSFEFESFPEEINNEVTQALKKPWQFFMGQNLKGLRFDTASRAIGAYDLNTGELLVPKLLLESPLVSQLSVMIHEATHSNPKSAMHADCYQGNLQGVAGCDDALEKRIKFAGAYSVEYWFLILVAKTKGHAFNDSDRKLALNTANDFAAHRFNHMFEQAQYNDVIVALNSKQEVLSYDPLFKEFSPIHEINKLGPTESLSHNSKTHGIHVYSKDKQIYSWAPDKRQVDDYHNDHIAPYLPQAKKLFRTFNPELKVNRNLILNNDDTLMIEGINSNDDRDYINFDRVNNVSSLHLLHGRNLVLLQNNGQVSFYNSEFKELTFPKLNTPNNIKSITPNHYGFSFYAIDTEGVVNFGRLKREDELPLEYSVISLEYSPDELQATTPTKAVKIQDGVGLRALLDDSGRIKVKKYHKYIKIRAQSLEEQEEQFLKSDEEIIDFVITKSTHLKYENSFIGQQEKIDFSHHCQVNSVTTEPWMQRLVGLSLSGNIVVWQNKQCRVLLTGILEFRFESSGIINNPYGYNQTQLTYTTKKGETFTVSPLLEDLKK